jgi:uncharacterized protein YjbI with pentapeptide repeats
MLNNNISGYKIRNQNNFKYLKNDSEHLLDKLKELTHNQLIEFKQVCDYLVVGLRDRYSGDKDYNGGKKISYFSADQKKANLNISFNGVKEKLQNISRTFRDYDVHLILALCTHRHTTFSKVEEYPKRLKNILNALNLNVNNNNLLFIKNHSLHYNHNTFFQFANKQFYHKNLTNCDFVRLNMKEAIFVSCDFTNGAIKKCNFNICNFNCSKFKDCNLYASEFNNCSFKECNFEDCCLEDTFFNNCDFENAIIERKWHSHLEDLCCLNFDKIIWI